MKIKSIDDIDTRRIVQMTDSETSEVYKLGNGSILKVFKPLYLNLTKLIGIDIERKILDAKPIKSSPEILVPTNAVYSQRNFVGYIMPMARGIDYNKMEDNLTYAQREDLHRYGRIHKNLENVIKKNPDIVFPDFCTCDNIFIDSNENVQFIDYDGLQVGKHKTLSTSTSLGNFGSYNNSKYRDSLNFYTKELDKRSLMILYFLSTFNVDLNKVGAIIPNTLEVVTLDMLFEYINLDDPDICHKVWKLFNDKEENEYLGDDVFNLAEKYDLRIMGRSGPGYYKRLFKK